MFKIHYRYGGGATPAKAMLSFKYKNKMEKSANEQCGITYHISVKSGGTLIVFQMSF